MNYTTGFFQNDLNVYYRKYDRIEKELSENPNAIDKNYKYDSNLYRIFYLFKGEATIRTDYTKQNIKSNTLVIINPDEKFQYNLKYNVLFEYLFIDVHPNTFKNIDDKNFYRPFYLLKNEQKIINSANRPELSSIINGIKSCICNSYTRCHIEAHIQSLFSRLCMLCDATYPPSMIENDNLPVRLVYYVKTHFTEDITYESLNKMFFISTPTINTIIKNFTGITLNEFITDLRLNNALNMIKDGFIDSTAKISELSGFNNYSTFYRAFKKKYGIMPSDLKKLDKRYWPLSK